MDGTDVPALRRRVLGWYDRNKRALPWRGRDMYGVWVSEVMLQQTRVDVAAPYYERWLRRWPTVEELAAAPEAAVLAAWSGLGYYSRARNLHKAARLIAQGRWPSTAAQWRDLPGIGPYSAAAIASIASGEAVAAIDGNVQRVAARILAVRGDPRAVAARRRIAQAAQAWIPARRPGDWNQALMDLGATVCTPRAPACDRCPVAGLCQTRKAGLQHAIPLRRRRAAVAREDRDVAIVRRGGAVLLVKPRAGLLRGMWGLPAVPRGADLQAHVAALTPGTVALQEMAAQAPVLHRFSHRTWRMHLHEGRVAATGRGGHGRRAEAVQPALVRARQSPGDEVRWMPVRDLAHEAVPAATKAVLAAAGVLPRPRAGGGQ